LASLEVPPLLAWGPDGNATDGEKVETAASRVPAVKRSSAELHLIRIDLVSRQRPV
jgi:hypothetical protein